MEAATAFQAVIDRYLAAHADHDAAGWAMVCAENGAIHSPFGPPATGHAEIEAEHLRWFEDGETNKTMVVTRAGTDGALGFCLVRFEADVPGEGGQTGRFRGTGPNVMERRSDGVWTIALTSLNELLEQDTDQDR